MRKAKKSKSESVKNKVILIGAPNTGKSTFFNKITNGTAAVSNIDRLTVSDASAKLNKHKDITIIDLPGLYNLSHPIDEELVVAHEIAEEQFSKIVNVIGAQSIERDLYLTIQAIESGLMSTLVINMIDEVDRSQVDVNKLSKALNDIDIIECQANRNIGTKKAIDSILNSKTVNPNLFKYPDYIENLISKISNLLSVRKISSRYYSLMILEQNNFIID
ncbi:MAG: 50S ribosome-binding GTPase [Mycoplasmoidaceae bacterium]|nr:50S ribosome-binding GTPase [Mycoplasmoidaceae bacterium]